MTYFRVTLRGRTQQLLSDLGVSARRQASYERGIDALDEAALVPVVADLEGAIEDAPAALVAAEAALRDHRQAAASANRARVMVISNDEHHLRDMRDALLTRVEYMEYTIDVDGQRDASAALAAAEIAPPDVLICDQLLETSGLEVVRRMRAILREFRGRRQEPAYFLLADDARQVGRAAAYNITCYPTSSGLIGLPEAVHAALNERRRDRE